MKVGDLVWCQNGIRKNMGIVQNRDPSYPADPNMFLQVEDYVWVILLEEISMGQMKWAKVKDLELISESR